MILHDVISISFPSKELIDIDNIMKYSYNICVFYICFTYNHNL